MSQVIAWILFIFVLIFIYKVGSFIWRILGVLFLLFLLWIYRDVIFTQVSQWTRDFRWDQLPTYLDQRNSMGKRRLASLAKLDFE